MSTIDDVAEALDLERLGDHRFRASHLDEGHGVVFGGQLLAQSVIAACATVRDKELLSMHTVFARGGRFDEPLDVDVEVLHSGRSMASVGVTTRQSAGICTRATALLHAPDDDRIRHADPMPEGVGRPDDWATRTGPEFWDLRLVGDVDIMDPHVTGPAELRAWSRFPDAPDDLAHAEALLAYASDGMLIATAMRPHDGVGQALAHVSIATTVLTQTITFHERFRATEWLLLDQRSSYAGRGRSRGEGRVFTADGRLVASFGQDNMIRAMA